MYLPWIIGAAIFIPAVVAYFVYFERRALKYPEKQATLSYAIYKLGAAFPLAIFLMGWVWGGLTIGLAVHFFWHWCPPGSVSVGMLGN